MADEKPVEVDVCDVVCFDQQKVNRIKRQVPSMTDLAGLFKVLADATRAKILYALSQEELCVCDLSAVLGTSISNASHHLRLLRAARLVKFHRAGKQVFYSLDDDHVLRLIREGFDHVGHG